MCVYLYTLCECVNMCTYLCAHAVEVSVFLSPSPSGFLMQDLSSNLEFTHSATLVGSQAPGICLSPSPWCWDCRHMPCHDTRLFAQVLGTQTQVLMLFGLAFYQLSHLSIAQRNFLMSESLQLHCSLRQPHSSCGHGTSELCHHKGCWVY